ncbi:O-methyltransferase [Mycotypha africana]|uniref:O-methyltransferase n=1 Tax=Mycotypha africana TaxID=64632 RepID=UPI0022FFFF2B|nr:O-methyltransferase [Mycotypha africana]KAI8970431.1 O-methyltransferase [Mycotypha africana]
MMISPLQAKLLHQLVCIFKPCRVLEIGGFTGYSAIAMGSALSLSSPNAKLISLESNIEHIRLASCYVQKAKLSSVISFIAGSAEDSIEKLHEMQRGKHEMFDFIFLDANKNAYTNYFDLIMRYDLLSDNGIMIVDNVLHWGQVHKEAGYEEAANRQKISKNVRKVASKVHKFNKHVKEDPRVDVVILPLFDGLSIIRKKHVS